MTDLAPASAVSLLERSPSRDRQWSRAVLAIAGLGVALRLLIAATTFGTDDVHYWIDFMGGAVDRGPWGIYGIHFRASLYNHGPLTSWLLVGLGELHKTGLPAPLLIRFFPSLADGVSTVAIFAILRPLRGERSALAAAALFALAPVAIIVSGFHGNTDPVFVALVLVAHLALRNRPSGWPAGVAFGLAVSVKLVPLVVLPLLLVQAAQRSRSVLRGFVGGGALVFAVLWVPVLLTHGNAFIHDVVLYPGIDTRPWGLSQAARWAGASPDSVVAWGNHVRFLVVLASALAAAAMAVRRPSAHLLGLPLCVFLLLSPAFSLQYLVWAVAAALVLVPLRAAAGYVAAASLFALVTYSLWCGAPPWAWHEAHSRPLSAGELGLMSLTWFSLAWVCVTAVREFLDPDPLSTGDSHDMV